MADIKDVMGLVKKGEKFADPLYSLSVRSAKKIINASTGQFDLVCNGFYFGYMQGVKATRAEMKRREAGE